MNTTETAPGSGFFGGRDFVRWGIVGCGDVTEVKSGPGLRKAQGSRLVAVMRRNRDLAADYARRHGVPKWYDDAQALIDDPEVDAVYVATPPDSHARYALAAAAVGKPAYVEKPMARHVVECDRMVEAFRAARIPLHVAYYRRRLPRFVLLQKLISDHAVGLITNISYTFSAPYHRSPRVWRVDAATAGAGHFLDMGSHALDLLDFLFGPLLDVAGTAANRATGYSVEDTVAMSFRTGSGITGAAAWNFSAGIEEDRLQISGTEGRITTSVFRDEPMQLEAGGNARLLDTPNPAHVQQPLIQSVVDDLLGRGACPSSGESARRTSAVMDTVLAAYYGGRDDAFWKREDSWPGRRS